MFASHGDGFPTGDVHGSGFQAIQEYFSQRSCKACSRPFSYESIELIREEPGVVVVRVGCSDCGQPLGIAVVGLTPSPVQQCTQSKRLCPPIKQADLYPKDWTKRDVERLGTKPRITFDDVLDAHSFFNELGSDWQKLLPRTGRSERNR